MGLTPLPTYSIEKCCKFGKFCCHLLNAVVETQRIIKYHIGTMSPETMKIETYYSNQIILGFSCGYSIFDEKYFTIEIPFLTIRLSK